MEELIALYVDDALTPAEIRQVLDHLEHCAHCREVLEDLRQMQVDLQSLPPEMPPSGFREDLLRMVAVEPKPKSQALRYLLPRLSSLAAVLLVLLLASNLYLFPLVWSADQSAAPDDRQISILMAPDVSNASGAGAVGEEAGKPEAVAPEGSLLPRAALKPENNTEKSYTTAMLPEDPEREPDLWLWSGLVAGGLFVLGAGYFVFRYRHSWL
jgi:hypothetical protein